MLLLQTKYCNPPKISVQSDTVYSFDTVYFARATKPKLIYSHSVDTFKIVDTIEVIRDYQTLKIYADSLKNDTISISIRDTIFKNAIIGRNIAYTLRLPTRTITNTIIETKEPSGLYLKAYASPINSIPQIGIGAVYVHKNWLGSAGYGTSGLQVGLGVKIF